MVGTTVKKIALSALILAFSASLGLAQQTHTLILAGYKAVPKVKTPAEGTVEVTLEGDSLSVEGSFSKLSSYYYGSGIFYGEKDEPGNQLLSLKPDVNDKRTSGSFKAGENTFKLTESMREALSEGELYIAVLSFDHSRGELRAQLPPFKNK